MEMGFKISKIFRFNPQCLKITQNVKRSSVARNVECDFFERFSNTVPGSFRGMHCKRIRKATTIVENNYENIPPKPELDPVPKRSLEYFGFPLQKKLPDRDKYPYIYCC